MKFNLFLTLLLFFIIIKCKAHKCNIKHFCEHIPETNKIFQESCGYCYVRFSEKTAHLDENALKSNCSNILMSKRPAGIIAPNTSTFIGCNNAKKCILYWDFEEELKCILNKKKE